MPDPIQPPQLATSGQRAKATAALHAAVEPGLLPDLLQSAMLIDVLDAVTTAVLRTAGLAGADAHAVVAVLWTDR
jgi:hypothetical protein